MSQRNGPAVWVDPGRIEVELARNRKRLCGEGFVELDDVNVGKLEPLFEQEL
jgi:hypothetical protein